MTPESRMLMRCSACEQPLALDHSGPCPNCGDLRRTYQIAEDPHALDIARWPHLAAYQEQHPTLVTVFVAGAALSPFLGMVLDGWTGVLVGLFSGAALVVIGIWAVTKAGEIRAGS